MVGALYFYWLDDCKYDILTNPCVGGGVYRLRVEKANHRPTDQPPYCERELFVLVLLQLLFFLLDIFPFMFIYIRLSPRVHDIELRIQLNLQGHCQEYVLITQFMGRAFVFSEGH